MTLKEGSELCKGRYQIKKVLGQGGMGITYLAWDKELSLDIAIKEFYIDNCCARDFNSRVIVPSESKQQDVVILRQRFKKEAQILANFKHSNIVRVYDVFEEHDTYYYSMEYIEGKSLQDCGGMKERDAVETITKVCEAVSYLHDNQTNHFDIKPANIMRGKDGYLCLIDFGISKVYDPEKKSGSTSSLVGASQGYSPLEQVDGRIKGFSPTADVYSLGATLFFLFTGVCPPSASDIINDGFPEKELEKVGVSSTCIKAVKRAMSPRANDRYSTVKEFVSALKSVDPKSDDVVPGKTLIKDHPVKPAPTPIDWKKYFVLLSCLLGLLALIFFLKYCGEDDGNYLTFTAIENSSIDIVSDQEKTPDVWFSIDGGNWEMMKFDSSYTLLKGQRMRLKGNNPNGFCPAPYKHFTCFEMTGKIDATGNVMSLIDQTGKSDSLPECEYCFGGLFAECEGLVRADCLPATKLSFGCYSKMFEGCKSLVQAPSLPATTMAEDCYAYMFEDCVSLLSGPDLPALCLASGCYWGMFSGCTSLSSAPKLSAIDLAEYCYQNMFEDCVSLKQAPSLPAVDLANSCYCEMFKGCSSLQSISVSFNSWGIMEYIPLLEIPFYQYTDEWALGLPGTGTFRCPRNLEKKIDSDHIPEGWTVETF